MLLLKDIDSRCPSEQGRGGVRNESCALAERAPCFLWMWVYYHQKANPPEMTPLLYLLYGVLTARCVLTGMGVEPV